MVWFWFYMTAITPVFGQDNVPLIGGSNVNNAFGAVVFKGTKVNDESVLMIGGRGGVILNNQFVIGAAFYQLFGDIEAPEAAQTIPDQTIDLDVDYLGLDLEYIFALHRSIHFSVQTLIGSGKAQYWKGNDTVLVEDGIFVVEPGLELTWKATSFFRIGLGASYRFVSDIEKLDGLENDNLRGPSANLTFRFGVR